MGRVCVLPRRGPQAGVLLSAPPSSLHKNRRRNTCLQNRAHAGEEGHDSGGSGRAGSVSRGGPSPGLLWGRCAGALGAHVALSVSTVTARPLITRCPSVAVRLHVLALGVLEIRQRAGQEADSTRWPRRDSEMEKGRTGSGWGVQTGAPPL